MTVYRDSSGSGKSKGKGKKSHHGILHNLVGDVKDATVGLIPGMAAIGHATLHDAGHALGLTSGPFQLDDIGKGIAQHYADYYALDPLVHGHLLQATHQFGHNVHDHPLDILLDASAAFTGGGSLLGKLGLKAAESAAEGSTLARLSAKAAGLEHTASSVGKGDLAQIAKTRAGVKGGAKGVVTRDGRHLTPKARERQSVLGGNAQALKVSNNPAIRVRRAALDKIAQSLDATNLPVVGGLGRLGAASRIGRAIPKDAKARAAADAASTAHAFNVAIGKLNKHERLAVRRLAAGHTPEEYAQHLEHQLEFGNIDPWDRGRILTRIKQNRHDAVAEAAGADYKNADKIATAVALAKELSRHNTDAIAELTGADAAALHAARGALENEIITGKAGKPGDYAVFTHQSVKRPRKGGTLKSIALDQKPGELRSTTGTAFRLGLESQDPRILARTAHDLAKHRAYSDVLKTMRAGAVEVGMDDPRLRDAYVTIPKDSAILGKLQDAQDLLLGDASHAFHDDPEGLAAIKQHFDDLLTKARSTDDGRVLAIPRPLWDSATKGLDRTSAAARLVDNITNAWRTIVLPLRPAWIANNLVGQNLLGALSVGPVDYTKGLIGQARGAGKRVLDANAAHLGASGPVHEGVINAMHTVEDASVGRKLARAVLLKPVSEASTRFNAWLTDNLPRRAVFLAHLKPMVKQLQHDAERHGHGTLTFEEAAQHILDNPSAVDHLTEQTIGDLVDFRAMTETERRYIRRAVPFYSWLRGIAVRTGDLVANDPVKALALAETSRAGIKSNAQELGLLPSYLQGVLPLGHPQHGHVNGLTTQGLNPFGTIADEAGILESIAGEGDRAGGGNPLSQLGPVFKVPIEAAMNQDPFTGRKVDETGQMNAAQRALLASLEQLPPVTAAGKAYGSHLQHLPVVGAALAPPSSSSIYEPSAINTLLGYLGYPRKTIRLDRAHQIAAFEKLPLTASRFY